MRRRIAVALVVLALVLPGCSLVYDTSGFHGADASTDTGRADDAGPTADTGMDASTGADGGIDAGLDGGPRTEDAGSDTGSDAGPRPDAGPLDAGPDAGPRPDAGPLSTCTGFGSTITIPLGVIGGLAPTIPTNVAFAVRAVGTDLAVVWVDASNAVRIHAFRVDPSTMTTTDLVPETSVGMLVGSGGQAGVGRDGNTWVVWGYSPTLMRRCTDGTSVCSDVTRPTDGASPYAFAQGATSFALVHSAVSSPEWRASILGAAPSLPLATEPAHVVAPDAIARTDNTYVAILDRSYLGAEQIAFAWFDQPNGAGATTTISTSAVGTPINGIYVTYDAMTATAVGVAATAPSTTHLLAAHSGVAATELTTWTSSSPRPLVARGDGTIFVSDNTGYALRALSAPTMERGRPGDPGALGAPVVLGGMYGYVAVYDMSVDEMALKLYPCL